MIVADLAKTKQVLAQNTVLPISYLSSSNDKLTFQHLSPVAQKVFRTIRSSGNEKFTASESSEIIALRLLDFLSSKQGYIRRKGKSFRKESFYLAMLPVLIRAIQQGQPVVLTSLCFCTTLANIKYAGESPYPHMGAYIALENLQKIALGARQIYAPGIQFVLGYEGSLFRPLYFQSEAVIRNFLAILREFNEFAYRNIAGTYPHNPIQIVDALWMIEQTFESKEDFFAQVEARKAIVAVEALAEWKAWYESTVSHHFFPSTAERRTFVNEAARWREAVYWLKYNGGKRGKGFIHFNSEVIPFTPAGRRKGMIALQLVPENSHLPHQRIMTYDPCCQRWRMMAYEDIQNSKTVYAPCFIERFSYPLYFEKIAA